MPRTASITPGAEWIASRSQTGSSAGLSESIAGLIRQGELPPGTRLPQIREVASACGLSLGAVASAWSHLRDRGYIDTRRRGGSHVTPPARWETPSPAISQTPRGWNLTKLDSEARFLPPLEAALAYGLTVRHLHSPHHEHLIEPLKQAVTDTWPFAAESWTTVGGVIEGLLVSLLTICGPKGVIAVEAPTNPRNLRVLRTLGLTVIRVPWDKEGPEPAALRDALDAGASAFLYQPRAHYPLSQRLSDARAQELVEVFSHFPNVVIVEDDNFGALAGNDSFGLGAFLPQRVLVSRAFCKPFGVDLRIAVLGGGARLIERIRENRAYGAVMTSRIFQGALAALLVSPEANKILAEARRAYGRRRQWMADALRKNGLDVWAEEGFSLWVRVADAASAMARLQEQHILLTPGSNCDTVAHPEHLCIAVMNLPDIPEQIDAIAAEIAAAASVFGGEA